LPSRECREGLAIFDALAAALRERPRAGLTIKPHPFDYSAQYAQRIKQHGLEGRVVLSGEPIEILLRRSSLVFSEDSSAGLDAMFFGRPLIHTHFSSAPPVMRFVDFGAALPGYSQSQISSSVMELESAGTAERIAMAQGQQRFIIAHSGQRDGRAAERLTDYIAKVAREHS